MPCLTTEKTTMTIKAPTSGSYESVAEEVETVSAPKSHAKVQGGWDALDALMKPVTTEYPTDFKFSEEPTLVKFLEDGPFAVYEQHWIDGAKGRKSFVCIGENCPLCDVLGDKPRGKFAWNVYVLSGETQGVQVMTVPPVFARQVATANKDERKGPLVREFWEISRTGMGPTTNYSLNYVRGRDLAEEWKLKLDEVNALVEAAVPYTVDQVVRETPRSDMLEVARSVA